MALDHEKKLAFVHRMTKMALEHVPHFDGGGIIGANPATGAVEGVTNQAGGVLNNVASSLTAQNGYQAQAPTSATTVGQQQATLAGQLGTEAAGGGPNPAQIQYEQNANQIAQQQATNYAQNRSLNPGLAARMAGNTAAQTGQTAAGGAAAQQAQQQLAAQQEMGQLTGQEQTGALGAAGINAQISQNNANAVNNTQGGILSGIGSALGSLFAKGGEVEKMAQGGTIQIPGQATISNAGDLTDYSGASAGAPNLSGMFSSGAAPAAFAKGGKVHKPMPNMATPPQYPSVAFAKGGKAEMMPQSFAGRYLRGHKMAGGGLMQTAMQVAPLALMAASKGGLMKSGGSVKAEKPSEKAKVKDDSLKNDKVPAMLSQGEIVIPRHITQHPDAARKAAAFVQSVLNKKRMGKK